MDIGDNAINFNAQRLVVEDLLALFQVVNEAVVNILGKEKKRMINNIMKNSHFPFLS